MSSVPIAVEVRGPHGETVTSRSILESGRGRGIDEVSLAVRQEEVVPRTLESERSHRDLLLAFPLKGSFGVEDICHRAVNVRGHVKIQISISIGVQEGSAGVPSRCFDSGLCRHVLEGPVAAVSIENVRPEVGDENVRPAVAIGVRHRDAGPPASLAGYSGSVGHILEGTVPAVAVKSVPPLVHDVATRELPTVDDVDVEISVFVEVEPRDTVPRGVEEMVFSRAPRIDDACDSRLLSDVGEMKCVTVLSPNAARPHEYGARQAQQHDDTHRGPHPLEGTYAATKNGT